MDWRMPARPTLSEYLWPSAALLHAHCRDMNLSSTLPRIANLCQCRKYAYEVPHFVCQQRGA